MTDKDLNSEVLAELLLQWEELLELGQETSAEELCQEHPNLVSELRHRIQAMKATAWLDNATDLPENAPLPEEPASRPSHTLINRYRLDNLVAEGGFAQVWRAYDLELQRTVAVKVPKPSRLQSKDLFMAEARRVARLNHPGIVPVYDVGVEDGFCFIVSAFVEGGSLADHLVNAPPSSQQSIRWVIEIAEALEYAHLHGIIHRDIKPANILIDHHNRALLADFGIAQSANRAGQAALSLGTLRYMSPEQLEGRGLDHRSDIFSLGVVLHELVTGRLPYTSLDPNTLRREISSGNTIRSSPNMPLALRQICTKALHRNPHQRYTSAARFSADLRRYLGTSGFTWLPWLAIASIVFLGGVLYLVKVNTPTLAKSDSGVEKGERNTSLASTIKAKIVLSPNAYKPGELRSDNGLMMRLIYCPSGEYLMGCPEGEPDTEPDETPQQSVALTNGFWIGQYEITQAEFLQVTGKAPWENQPFAKDIPDAAASYISWDDADDFCKKFTKKEREEGRLGEDEVYRLPSEAEWEYAGRAGSQTRYSFGTDVAKLDEYAWFKDNTHFGDERYTHRVGQKKPNPWGIFDIHGNAWEWCLDRFSDKRFGGINPIGNAKGKHRVLRGAGWTSTASNCRISDRDALLPNLAKYYIGFRIVRANDNSR